MDKPNGSANPNWASHAMGCRVVECSGNSNDVDKLLQGEGGEWCGGDATGYVVVKLAPRSATLKYIGWESPQEAASPALVAVSCGEDLHTLDRVLRTEGKGGAGVQTWLIPKGIAPSHTLVRLDFLSSCDPTLPVKLRRLFLHESHPVVAPTCTTHRTPKRGRSSPGSGVLDGLSEDIHRLRGIRSPAVSPMPPYRAQGVEMDSLQVTLNELRGDVTKVLEGQGGLSRSILHRLEECEKDVAGVKEENKRITERMDYLERRLEGGAKDDSKYRSEAGKKSTTTTTITTTTAAADPSHPSLHNSYLLLDRVKQLLPPEHARHHLSHLSHMQQGEPSSAFTHLVATPPYVPSTVDF